MKFISFDSEDDSRGNIYMINFYNGKDHFTFHDKRSAWDWLRKQKCNKFFAHNLEYDLINLAYPYFIDQIEFYYISGRLIYAKIRDTRKKFFDSFNFSFSSLKAIGKVVGLAKLDTDDFNNVEYCRRDTEIVHKYIKHFNEQIRKEFSLKPKTTLAGTAHNIFLRRFDEHRCGGKNTDNVLLQSYYGGRCECFYIGKVENYVFETDINSSYPNVMKNYEYPTGEYYETITPESDMYVAHVHIKVKTDAAFPIIPCRTDRLYFPTGEFTTWATSAELAAAEKFGQLERVDYVSTYNFPEYHPIFERFIDYFYSRRKVAKDNGDTFLSTYYKLIMNSTYGRFALSNGLSSFEMKGGEFVSEPIPIESKKTINYSIPIFVTAYARLELLKLIYTVLSTGAKVLYCDTDSVYFTFPEKIDLQSKICELHGILPVDNELGNVSLNVYANGAFYNAKQYVLTSISDQVKIKCKGIPEKNRKEFIETGKTKYERPVKLRTFAHSIDKTFPPNFWKEFFVEKQSEYRKRHVLKNGDTTPLVF